MRIRSAQAFASAWAASHWATSSFQSAACWRFELFQPLLVPGFDFAGFGLLAAEPFFFALGAVGLGLFQLAVVAGRDLGRELLVFLGGGFEPLGNLGVDLGGQGIVLLLGLGLGLLAPFDQLGLGIGRLRFGLVGGALHQLLDLAGGRDQRRVQLANVRPGRTLDQHPQHDPGENPRDRHPAADNRPLFFDQECGRPGAAPTSTSQTKGSTQLLAILGELR